MKGKFCQLSVVGACRNPSHREACVENPLDFFVLPPGEFRSILKGGDCCCKTQCVNCEALAKTDLPAQVAEFELTEEGLMDELKKLQRELQEKARAIGLCWICLNPRTDWDERSRPDIDDVCGSCW